MKKFLVVNIDVVVKARRGDVITNNNITDIVLEQNESSWSDIQPEYYDTIEDAKRALKNKPVAKVRAYQTQIKGKYEVRANYWQIEEWEVDEDGDLLTGADIWEVSSFEIVCE